MRDQNFFILVGTLESSIPKQRAVNKPSFLARSFHTGGPSTCPKWTGLLNGIFSPDDDDQWTEGVKEVRLETERLVLRMYRLSDFEDHFRLCGDPDVMRYLIGGKPMSRLEAWRHMAFLVGHWELLD